MVNFLKIINFLLLNCDLLLLKLSKPNPKYYQDKIDYEMNHRKNCILLKGKLLLLLVFITDMLINRISISVSIIRCLTTLVLMLGMIFSCQYHPFVLKVFKSCICLAYGVYIMDKGEAGIHRAWFLAFIFPIYLYVFTGSWWCFLFQAIAQLFFINTLYKRVMENAFMFMTPEAFSKTLIYSTNLAIIFMTLLIILMHYFMQHAYKKISLAEKRKEEVEKQKIFLLGFSHELRNLINSLTGNVKLATLEILSPKVKELLKNAELCGELLLHLINNILDTGKVEIGELEINPEPIRIYDTLERIWGVCSELIKTKTLAGQMKIPKNLPKCMLIDHYRLTQIFLNLVGNAVKFTDNGSVDISVEWLGQNETVDESCFQPYPFNYYDDHDEGLFEKYKTLSSVDKNLLRLDLNSKKINQSLLKEPIKSKKGVFKIVISDTGCGMSGEDTKKLFQKFSQISPDKSKRKLGTGLGLFITKELCQRMQGDIKLFSVEGCGSSFIFCFPVEVVEENSTFAQDSESLKSFLKYQNLEAMIVDDVPFNHTVLRNFFDKLGIKVTEIANNGLEGYNKYYEHIQNGKRPHIITMDLDMPIMDGKESARRIRRLEQEMKLEPSFLIIISGNCSESEIFACLNKHGDIRANRFMKKPVNIEEFSQILGSYFAQKQIKIRNE